MCDSCVLMTFTFDSHVIIVSQSCDCHVIWWLVHCQSCDCHVIWWLVHCELCDCHVIWLLMWACGDASVLSRVASLFVVPLPVDLQTIAYSPRHIYLFWKKLNQTALRGNVTNQEFIVNILGNTTTLRSTNMELNGLDRGTQFTFKVWIWSCDHFQWLTTCYLLPYRFRLVMESWCLNLQWQSTILFFAHPFLRSYPSPIQVWPARCSLKRATVKLRRLL